MDAKVRVLEACQSAMKSSKVMRRDDLVAVLVGLGVEESEAKCVIVTFMSACTSVPMMDFVDWLSTADSESARFASTPRNLAEYRDITTSNVLRSCHSAEYGFIPLWDGWN